MGFVGSLEAEKCQAEHQAWPEPCPTSSAVAGCGWQRKGGEIMLGNLVNSVGRVHRGHLLSSAALVLLLILATAATTYAFSLGPIELSWGRDQPMRTVCYYVTPGATSRWGTPIQHAASTWSNAGARFRFLRYQNIDDCEEENYVNKMAHMPPDNTGQPQVGRTWFKASAPPGEDFTLTRARTWLNSGDYQWSTNGHPPPGCNGCQWYDAETIILHEFGHWLHLDHTGGVPSIMGQHARDHVQHTLDNDDKNGITFLYGSW